MHGPEASGAVPALSGALEDPDPLVRCLAAAALGKIGPAAHAAVPHLIEVLGDDMPPLGFWAADALGRIGEGTEAVRAALSRVVRRSGPRSPPGRAAVGALARLERTGDDSQEGVRSGTDVGR